MGAGGGGGGALADQNFSLAPSAPISLDQKFSSALSAPPKAQRAGTFHPPKKERLSVF